MTLCEAAAKGLPIIRTDAGYASHLDDCCVVRSVTEMAQAMRNLEQSPQERWEWGSRLRNYAEAQYRIQDKVDRLEEQLIRLVDEV